MLLTNGRDKRDAAANDIFLPRNEMAQGETHEPASIFGQWSKRGNGCGLGFRGKSAVGWEHPRGSAAADGR
jgi:hypothetical protein